MQDNQPLQSEIQVLLSQYLDGILPLNERNALEARLANDPDARAELQKMQALQAALQRGVLSRQMDGANEPSPGSDGVWANIARQLAADESADVLPADAEVISAYYDGEIQPSEREAFERQLPANPEANALLADVAEISETVRHYSYRLESACTVNVTDAVMAAFHHDQPLPVSDERFETLSAFVDNELGTRDIIAISALVEAEPEARDTVVGLGRLSEAIQQMGRNMEAMAPDCWPAVQAKLSSDNVVPMTLDKKRRANAWQRVAIPASVAAVLLLVALPLSGNWQAGSKQAGGYELSRTEPVSIQSSSTNNFTPVETRGVRSTSVHAVNVNHASKQLASAGAGFESRIQAVEFIPQRFDESFTRPAMQASRNIALPVKPMLEPARDNRIVMAEPSGTRASRTATRAHRPSSEEYLFSSLSEHMSSEELLILLGE